MTGEVLDVKALLNPDDLAVDISAKWVEWNGSRAPWLKEVKDLRNYVFATDTTTTVNKTLPWSNTTTTPKLCQIFDNLKANYSAALFPQTRWSSWLGRTPEDRAKATVIEDFMAAKLVDSGFEKTMDRLVDDWVLTGNCFGTVEYITDYTTLPSGEVIQDYVGPRLVRISPYDIVFNPTAKDFRTSPKIVRSLYTLGDIKKMAMDVPEKKAVFEKILQNRTDVGGNKGQVDKADGFWADGFGDIGEYYASGLVEVLTFYGDVYDTSSEEYLTAQEVVIVDRAYVISKETTSSWLGTSPVFHSSWRTRPDNLYGMGPLDNLVGMQYRIDHLENLKADAFDLTAVPIYTVQGSVEDFEIKPGERIIMGEDGQVGMLRPDGSALQADFQISALEQKMEDFAGAPRSAMGIRTPGEKTAFEVGQLADAGSRIFNNKAAKLEKEFIEPCLNSMLEASRRNMVAAESVYTTNETSGSEAFLTITKEDIIGSGSLRPVGARHFAERAQRVQTLTTLLQVKQDPSVAPHISGKRIAQIISQELGEEGLYAPNVAVEEQAETAEVGQDVEADQLERQEVKAEHGL